MALRDNATVNNFDSWLAQMWYMMFNSRSLDGNPANNISRLRNYHDCKTYKT